MESSSKMVERRVVSVSSSSEAAETSAPSDKWEYQGYGIWESNESRDKSSDVPRMFRPIDGGDDAPLTSSTSKVMRSSTETMTKTSSIEHRQQSASSATQGP